MEDTDFETFPHVEFYYNIYYIHSCHKVRQQLPYAASASCGPWSKRTRDSLFNFAALLDFPNVIRPNESNPIQSNQSINQSNWILKKNVFTELQKSLSPCK